MNLEELRQSYRPATVQVLLVGESPPASGAFFYSGDSELYRSTRDAFAAVFPEFRNAESFLEQFSHLGCFLDDLSHEPVNQYTGHDSASRRMRLRLRRDGETRLATTIAKLKPKVIIVLLKGIVENVERSIERAGFGGIEMRVVTYPSRWHRHRLAYRAELTSIVRDLVSRGILKTP